MTPTPSPNLPPPFPPPGQMPPVYFPPPMYYPPPRERGGFARAIFTTLAVSILGFSITLNIYLLIAQGLFSGGDGTGIKKETLTKGNAQSVIAVVPLEGVIWGSAAEDVDALLDAVEADPAVKAVVLHVDSPGGEVTASDEIYNRLLRFKKEKNVPLIVSMRSMAASGGYYVACAGDRIVAQRTTDTGSIGVYLGSLNISKFMEKYGIEDKTVTASGNDFKLVGSPYQPMTKEQEAYLQQRANADMETFKSVIMAGRKLDRASVDRVSTGEVFKGPDAQKLKLVDDIGFLDDAIQIASSTAGVSGAQVVRYSHETSFWDALSGKGQQGRHGRTAGMLQAEVGDVKLSVDPRQLSELLRPRPMFMYRGQ